MDKVSRTWMTQSKSTMIAGKIKINVYLLKVRTALSLHEVLCYMHHVHV